MEIEILEVSRGIRVVVVISLNVSAEEPRNN